MKKIYDVKFHSVILFVQAYKENILKKLLNV